MRRLQRPLRNEIMNERKRHLILLFLSLLVSSCVDKPRSDRPASESPNATAAPTESAAGEGDSHGPTPVETVREGDETARPEEPGVHTQVERRIERGIGVPPQIYERDAPLAEVPEEALGALWSPATADSSDLLRFLPPQPFFAMSLDIRGLHSDPILDIWETALLESGHGFTVNSLEFCRESFSDFASITERCVYGQAELFTVIACEGDYSDTGWRPDTTLERVTDVPERLEMVFFPPDIFILQDRFLVILKGVGAQQIVGGHHVWIAERAVSPQSGDVLVLGRALDTRPAVHLLETGELRVYSSLFTNGPERATLVELVGQYGETADGETEVEVTGTLVYSSEEVSRRTKATSGEIAFELASFFGAEAVNTFASTMEIAGPTLRFSLPNDLWVTFAARMTGGLVRERLDPILWRQGPRLANQIMRGVLALYERGASISSVPRTPPIAPCLSQPNTDPTLWETDFWQEIGFAPEATRFAFELDVTEDFEPGKDRLQLHVLTFTECGTPEINRHLATGWIQNGELTWEGSIVAHGTSIDFPEMDPPQRVAPNTEESTPEQTGEEKPPVEE